MLGIPRPGFNSGSLGMSLKFRETAATPVSAGTKLVDGHPMGLWSCIKQNFLA
jgi:hypothetical protein